MSENVTPTNKHAGIGNNDSTVKKSQTPTFSNCGGLGDNNSTVKRHKPLAETNCLNANTTIPCKKVRTDSTFTRGKKLREVLEKVLVMSVDSFSFQDMRDCFPELSKAMGPELDGFCVDILQGIRSCVGEEFQSIMEANNAYPQLNRLEHLYETQPKSFKTGLRRPPSLIKPEQILKQQVLEAKKKHVQDLEAQVDKIFKKNQVLKSAVIAQRALTKKMEDKMNTLFLSSTQVVESCRDAFPEN